MYDKVSPNLNFVEREKKTEKFWEDNHIFQKSIDERKEGEVYTFYDGPPKERINETEKHIDFNTLYSTLSADSNGGK